MNRIIIFGSNPSPPNVLADCFSNTLFHYFSPKASLVKAKPAPVNQQKAEEKVESDGGAPIDDADMKAGSKKRRKNGEETPKNLTSRYGH